MNRFVDLRCSRRITLAEARLILALLADQPGRVASRARVKIEEAVKIADHQCVYKRTSHGRGLCIVCRKWPMRKREVPEAFKRPRLRLTPVGRIGPESGGD